MNEFGRFLRAKREEQRVSLRAFALGIEMDPSNYSKIERGVLPPPDGEMLERIGDEIGIQRSTEEWQRFYYMASVARGQIPSDIAQDEDIMAALPAFFQRLREEKVATRDMMFEAFKAVIRES